MRILLDTNLLLRMEDTAHPHHTVALGAVERLSELGQNCVAVPQVFYEFWVVATRPLDKNGLELDVSRVDQVLTEIASQFPLLLDERRIYRIWRDAVRSQQIKGKKAHDARLVAAMQQHGITHLLTFNVSDFARFPGIMAFSPADVVAGKLPAGLA